MFFRVDGNFVQIFLGFSKKKKKMPIACWGLTCLSPIARWGQGVLGIDKPCPYKARGCFSRIWARVGVKVLFILHSSLFILHFSLFIHHSVDEINFVCGRNENGLRTKKISSAVHFRGMWGGMAMGHKKASQECPVRLDRRGCGD